MKHARMWILVTLLLAQSMAASLNTLPGEDLRSAEWEGPMFETGGRSSGCGYNASLVNVTVWTTPSSPDHNDDVNATFYIQCNIVGSTHTMYHWLSDSGGNQIQSGNWSWTPTNASWAGNSEIFSNMSADTYTLDYYLTNYTGGVNVTGSLEFTVQSPTCTVSPYSGQSMFDIGEDFTGQIDSYCSFTNEAMNLSWSLINDDTNATLDSGSFSWTSMNTGEYHSVNSTALSTQGEGNYSFLATLSWFNTSSMMWEELDDGSNWFMVYDFNSTGGSTCGSEPDDASVWAYSDEYEYGLGEDFGGVIYTYCALLNETVMLDWSIVNTDANSTVDTGSFNWTAMQTDESHNVTSTALAMESVGNYTFTVDWTWYNTSSMMWEDLDSDHDDFMIANLTSGTGNSCSVYAWSNHSVYDLGESFTGEIDTYCSFTNESMSLAWTIMNDDTNSTVDSGLFNWTSMTYGEFHPVNSSNLAAQGEGNYSFTATISWYNTSSMMWEALDSDTDHFMIDNSSGSTLPLCSLYAWPSQTTFNVGDNFSGEIYSSCNFVGEYVNLTYWITDDATGSYVDWGIFSWTNTVYSETHSINSSNLATVGAGNYTFGGVIALWENGTGWTALDMDNASFVVASGSTPTWNLSDGELDIDTYGEYFTSGTALYAHYEATNLTTGQTYRVEWEIVDTNSTIVVENYTDWNATSDSYIFSVYEAGLADGYYCFYGDLYATETVNNTTVTSMWIAADDTCVTLGEDDDNATNQTGCGYDTEDFYITGWVNNWDLYEGDTANISVYTNCNLLNETMFVSYGVTDSGENTIAEGQWSWTAMSIMEEHFIEAMNLSTGVYNVTLVASYYNESTVLDSYFFQFNVSEVATNNTGCGYEYNEFSVSGWVNNWDLHEGDTANISVYTNCNMLNETMRIVYQLFDDDDNLIVSGNWTWNAMSLTEEHFFEASNLSAGAYTVELSGTWLGAWVDWREYDFGFNVSEPTGCGYSAEDAMVTGWNNTGYVMAGGTLNVTAYTECAVLGQWMTLHYSVYDPEYNLIDSGNWSWIANMLDEEHHLEVTDVMAGAYNFSFSLATPYTYSYVDHYDVMVYVDEAPDTGTENNNTSTTNTLPECFVYAYVSAALVPDADPTSISGMAALELPLNGSATVPLVPGTYVIAVVCTDADGDALTISLTSNGQTFSGMNYNGQFFAQAFFQVSNAQDFTHQVTVEWDDGVDSGVLDLTMTSDLQSVIDDLEEEEAGGLPGFGAVSGLVAIAIGVAVSGRRKDE